MGFKEGAHKIEFFGNNLVELFRGPTKEEYQIKLAGPFNGQKGKTNPS